MNHGVAGIERSNTMGGTILLVDDEPELLATTSEALRCSGYQVLQAHDGVEAVDLYKAHREDIALVLIDVVMPRLNGVDATCQIRELDPSAKVILSTGYSDRSLAEAKPDAVLPKPYRIATLRDVVRQVLNIGFVDLPDTAIQVC